MTQLAGTLIQPQTEALFAKHREKIENAVAALRQRTYYEQYPENIKAYPETAQAEGHTTFEAQLGKPFIRIQQAGDTTLVAAETSPYTRKALGIGYPAYKNPADYVAKASEVWHSWRKTSPETRAALLVEALDRIQHDFFEIAYATQHTTGQGFMMSFQASGPHANDRALEAIALAWEEQSRVPQHLTWDKPMGKYNVVLEKYYRIVPKGVAVAIGCSTFPIWNSVPGIFASLATGNPVIAKPHPTAVYPLAIIISRLQEVLKEFGFPAELVQLAPDAIDAPITEALTGHPSVKIIDYTGGNSFGDYVEGLTDKTTFTEKAGINSIIIDSTTDLAAMVQNLAFSVALYSGQMCTRPQNFFIPKGGIAVGDDNVAYAEVADALVKAIRGLTQHPKAGPAVCGALQNASAVKARMHDVEKMAAAVLLPSEPIVNPEFPEAQTCSPLVLEMRADDYHAYANEWFGPVCLVIPTDGTLHSVALAKQLAEQHGAISCGAYTTSPQMLEMIADEMTEAATPVSFNLLGQVYVNQNASFSDFHVTGGNPAGNATFTDSSFVSKRFHFVGLRVQK